MSKTAVFLGGAGGVVLTVLLTVATLIGYQHFFGEDERLSPGAFATSGPFDNADLTRCKAIVDLVNELRQEGYSEPAMLLVINPDVIGEEGIVETANQCIDTYNIEPRSFTDASYPEPVSNTSSKASSVKGSSSYQGFAAEHAKPPKGEAIKRLLSDEGKCQLAQEIVRYGLTVQEVEYGRAQVSTYC